MSAANEVKVTMLCITCLFSFLLLSVEAQSIGPLILSKDSSDLSIGSTVQYTCSSNPGTAGDPLFEWSIRDSSFTIIPSNIAEVAYSDKTDINDGDAESTAQFLMESRFLYQYVYCRATSRFGNSNPSIIYGNITLPTGNLGQQCNTRLPSCNTNDLTCVNGFCQCASGYIQSGTICTQESSGNLGEECGIGRICSLTSLTCNSQNICECASGYYQSGINCLPLATIGAFCIVGNDAMCGPTETSRSYCDPNSSTCQCEPGFELSNGDCVLDNTANLGESCANGQSCITQFSACSGFPQTCQCQSPYFEANNQCILSTANLGESCANGQTCSIQFSQCQGFPQTCQCQSNYIQVNNQCALSTANLGESCANGQTCSIQFSQCQGFPQTCQCQSNYIQVNNQCALSTANLGESCANGQTCIIQFSQCQGFPQTCQCQSNYIQVNNQCALSTANLGESCANGQTCSIQFSQCTGFPQTCQCQSNYIQVNNQCALSTANLGESCANGQTCIIQFSQCQGFPQTCQCQSNYIQVNNQCALSTANLGESCANGQTCIIQFSQCTGFPQTCQCQSNYIQVNNQCALSTATLGDTCAQGQTCITDFSTCSVTTQRCTCRTGYMSINNNECILETATLGETCALGQTCSTPFSICDGVPQFCVCQANFYRDDTGVQPACIAKAEVGANCNSNIQGTCLRSNSACVNSVCQCFQNYELVGLECALRSTAAIGESCDGVSTLCPSNAQCIGSPPLCQCTNGYLDKSGVCTQPTLGEPCQVSVGCQTITAGGQAINSECLSGVCSCPSADFYTLNGQCLPKSVLGQVCNVNVLNSCQDAHAVCQISTSTTATCQCQSDYTQNGASCIPDTSILRCPTTTVQTTATPGVDLSAQEPAPNVRVGAVCYDVPLFGSRIMTCEDTRQVRPVQYANWQYYSAGSWSDVVKGTDSFINGDAAKPSMTVSNAQPSYAGRYRCVMCYGNLGSRVCTTSEETQLIVQGTQIASATATMSPSPAIRGSPVTLTCTTSPAGVATSYRWLLDGRLVSTNSVYEISSAQPSHDGSYVCEASNDFGQADTSNTPLAMSVSYVPEVSIQGGGNSKDVYGNLTVSSIELQCEVNANPPVHTYYFYNNAGRVVFSSSSTDKFIVSEAQGYGRYYCRAENSIGTSAELYFFVRPVVLSNIGESCVNDGSCRPANSFCNTQGLCQCNSGYVQEGTGCTIGGPNIGAATEDSGLTTGTIAAIVLGIIFLILLIIIIIVCCCSYGWCRKKEKVQPEVIQQPIAKQYIPRTLVSASAVSRKDVGILVKGQEVLIPGDEPHYAVVYPLPGKHLIDPWDDSIYAEPVHYMTPGTAGDYNVTPVVAQRIPETGYRSRKPPIIRGVPDVDVYGTPHYFIPPTQTEDSSSEPEERYTTPRYHLKPATNGGPIISMYDDSYNQPRPLQLPALDTQYLYTDEEPKKRRKRRKKHRSDRSPRRSYYEPDPDQEEVDTKYAEVLDSRSDDLVVVPGKQNYFE